MRKIFLALTTLFFSSFGYTQVICIDPGHGYGTQGEDVDGRTTTEIHTNCEVGLKLRDTLEKKGYTVIMTREDSDTGSWMSLTQRAELADTYEAERLLSIHCNAGGGTGTETFWCHINSPNRAIDSTFSRLVQDNMAEYGEWRSRRSIEDIKYLGFHLGVLKGAAPGCLNEIGFVDTPEDSAKLVDEDWQWLFAAAYTEAIDISFTIDYPSYIIENQLNVNIYPNPVNKLLILKSEEYFQTNTLISLYDIQGILLNNFQIESPQKEYLIHLADLKKGLYVIQIAAKDSIVSLLFVKPEN
ncbi:MAG: N-acetylmuramoyl-L-alanine amidase [Bacteroidales bacterium]|nr:N-acetylmuramoyl-L-alanine amidase [Bacteroidales bacterium]MBN2817387.1 N-acetylmuramoyl-L-alanine amidase [Bacteroidales bacterium]